MKNLALSLIIVSSLILFTCKKDDPSERFNFLTGTVWVSDSLLANGINASGLGGVLEDFKGEAKFNKDGTGNFGNYSGTWSLAFDDTEIIISTDSLPLPLTTQIAELTSTSLKITTGIPDLFNPMESIKIRMTFKSK